MEVTLYSYTENPIEELYLAYRVCYSALSPQRVVEKIDKEQITFKAMEEFVTDKIETGHDSPLRQVQFTFLVSGVSRVLTHQLVRHSIGWNFEQQSQRYVNFTKQGIKAVIPPSIVKNGFEEKFIEHNKHATELYIEMTEAGVPTEDARFVFLNAATSNLKFTVSLPALQHFLDIRLCTRAQWEIRALAQKMRVEVIKEFPWMSGYFGIKCEANRLGYCNEPFGAYEACPLSRIRPHKRDIIS